jgi:hypothetical protein
MIALVLGYENIDLKKRFPDQKMKTLIDLPENNSESPNFRDRISSLFWIVSFLIISNFLIIKFSGRIPMFYRSPISLIPNLENSHLTYLCIIFLLAVPFLIKRKDVLREWGISGIIGLSCSLFIALLYPSVGMQYLPPQDPVLTTLPVFLLFISLKAIRRQSLLKTGIFTIVVLFLAIIQLINSQSAILHMPIPGKSGFLEISGS